MGGCRRILWLDGCFLKHTCKGQLHTTMGRDANKAAGENNSQVTRHGKQIRCSNCQGVGHNKASCENPYIGGMGFGIRAMGTDSGGRGGRSDGRETMDSVKGRRGGAKERRGGGIGGRRGNGRRSTSILKDMKMKNVMNLNQMLADNDVAYDVITTSCTEISNQYVENCFAKHGSKFIKTNRNLTVIEGYVVIAKNPCLHPRDIQVLKAVNVSGLEHLVDRLIFPQKGERPHMDEASGSDLDGDLCFVT
nr:RNA-dependent RNA polymerase 6-like [Tanacetum cinerariifolium]